MMERNIYYILTLLLWFFCSAQKNTSLNPVKGDIVFYQKEIIMDRVALENSIQALFSGAAESAARESGKEHDISHLVAPTITGFEQLRHFTFRESEIVAYQTINGKVFGDYTLINQKAGTTTRLAKKDSITRYQTNQPYQYSQNKIIKITELANETKTINGYTCFKVLVTLKEYSDDPDYADYISNDLIYKELWVTDKIKCMYHPVIREKEILEKYYPLYVLEYSDTLKGVKTEYSLVTITLK